MIVDANVLLHARNAADARHEAAASFLDEVLNGPHRVGLPWSSLTSFLRIATHPRVFARPLSAAVAAEQVREWLAAPAAWVPAPGEGHAVIFLELISRHRITGTLISDAALAALALEHGTGIWSTDGDFARFDGLDWQDPLAGR
jgi:toxin-antitoxin system PIN domain toxin